MVAKAEAKRAAEARQKPAAEQQPEREPQYRQFANLSEADAWTNQHYGDFGRKLTEAQRNAVEDYRQNEFLPINKALRQGGVESLSPSQQATVKRLDAVLEKRPLPEGITVQRMIDFQAAGINPAELRPGAEIVDRGFVSTSINPKYATIGQRLEIRVPKGTPAAFSAASARAKRPSGKCC